MRTSVRAMQSAEPQKGFSWAVPSPAQALGSAFILQEELGTEQGSVCNGKCHRGEKKKDISYLCIFVWHEELFTMGPAPSIATLLPAAPTLVLTHSQHCRPSRSHTGFGKVWKGSGAEQPPPPIPYRKRKEHEFFLLKIFF